MAYRDAIVVRLGSTDYAVDPDGNVKRIETGRKFKAEMTEATIQRVRLKAADLRAVRDEAEQREVIKQRREKIKEQMIGILRG